MGAEQLLTWDEILTRLQSDRSDESAWSSLFDRGWPVAVATAARQLGNVSNLLEDVAQETLFRLLKYCKFERLGDGGALRAYLKETARNVARDSWKASASEPRAISIDMDNLVDERAVTADLVAAARELLHDSSIQRLDPIDRRIVEGLAVGGSRSELLDMTGLNYSALSVRIHRLRTALRNLLER